LNYGLSKLIYNGFVEKCENRRYKATDKSRLFYNQHEIKPEGCIDTLFRLSDIFVRLEAKTDCQLFKYITIDEYHKALPQNRLLNYIAKLLVRN